MLIRLPGADFSAENIGTIVVPHSLNAFTEAAIAASGNASLTDLQKYALDDFFLTIGAGGISSSVIAGKMRYVFLPILAGSLDKALVDYKSGDFSVVASPSSTYWSLNKGLVAEDSGSSGAITFSLNSPILADSASLLVLRGIISPGGAIGNQHYLSLRGKTNTGRWLSFYQYGASDTTPVGKLSTGGLPGQWISGSTEETRPTPQGYNIYGGIAQKILGGVVSTITPPEVDFSTETSQTVYAFGMSSKNVLPTALAMLGEGLTDAELSACLEAITNLRDAFGL